MLHSDSMRVGKAAPTAIQAVVQPHKATFNSVETMLPGAPYRVSMDHVRLPIASDGGKGLVDLSMGDKGLEAKLVQNGVEVPTGSVRLVEKGFAPTDVNSLRPDEKLRSADGHLSIKVDDHTLIEVSAQDRASMTLTKVETAYQPPPVMTRILQYAHDTAQEKLKGGKDSH
jgi:hypothetical protein